MWLKISWNTNNKIKSRKKWSLNQQCSKTKHRLDYTIFSVICSTAYLRTFIIGLCDESTRCQNGRYSDSILHCSKTTLFHFQFLFRSYVRCIFSAFVFKTRQKNKQTNKKQKQKQNKPEIEQNNTKQNKQTKIKTNKNKCKRHTYKCTKDTHTNSPQGIFQLHRNPN